MMRSSTLAKELACDDRLLARIKILATYERVALEKQEGQIAEAVNSRPWSQGIN